LYLTIDIYHLNNLLFIFGLIYHYYEYQLIQINLEFIVTDLFILSDEVHFGNDRCFYEIFFEEYAY
jgi:hypothetical protein